MGAKSDMIIQEIKESHGIQLDSRFSLEDLLYLQEILDKRKEEVESQLKKAIVTQINSSSRATIGGDFDKGVLDDAVKNIVKVLTPSEPKDKD